MANNIGAETRSDKIKGNKGIRKRDTERKDRRRACGAVKPGGEERERDKSEPVRRREAT